MKRHNRRLICFFVCLFSLVVQVRAQAPAALSGFDNRTLVLWVTNDTTISGGAFRFYTNGTAAFTGGYPGAYGSTNAVYSQDTANLATLVLATGPTPPFFRETNTLKMFFQSATNGLFTNILYRSSVSGLQTNKGAFTIVNGTNIVPAVYGQFGPTDGIVVSNNSASISVSAMGFGISYQWRFNGGNLAGAVQSYYSMNNFLATNVGSYTCVLSNAVGVSTSAPMNLRLAVPVGFAQQPLGAEVPENSYFELSYVPTGDVFYPYWQKNGSATSITNNPLIFPYIKTTDAGAYRAALNGYGNLNATSSVANVIVRSVGAEATWLGRPFVRIAAEKMPVPGFTGVVFSNWVAAPVALTFLDGTVHFTANTSASDASVGLFRWRDTNLSALVFSNTPAPGGAVFQNFFYPTDEGDGRVNFTASTSTNASSSTVPQLSAMFEYQTNGTVSPVITNTTPVAERPGFNFYGMGSYSRRGKGVAISAAIKSDSEFSAGIWFLSNGTLTRICDNTTPLSSAMSGYGFRPTTASINYDGQRILFSTMDGTNGGFYASTTNGVITKLADSQDTRPGSTAKFSTFGDIDCKGGAIFVSANNILYAFDGVGGMTNLAVGAANVCAAGTNAAYFGTTTSLKRWNNGAIETVLSSGNIVDGKTVSTIETMRGQGDDVVVALKFSDNSYGIYLVSGTAPVSPRIVSEPVDFKVLEGMTAKFAVTAAGQPSLTYQWRKDGSLLSGMTNAFLTLSNVQASSLGGYSVIVANNNGSVTSRVATLSKGLPIIPLILTNPAYSGTPYFGSNTTLFVSAVGAPPLSYSWYRGDTLIPGVSGSELNLPNLSANDRANYKVVLSNGNGSVTSPSVTFGIYPIFKQQPVSGTVLPGDSFAFSVQADGIPPFTYQWYRRLPSFQVLAGQTNSTLSFTNVNSTNAGTYSVNITSAGNGVISSSNVTLTVVTNPVYFELTTNVTPVSSGSITVSPLQTNYLSNSVVTLTAIPASGKAFAGWTGATNTSANPIDLTMNEAKSVTATFTNAVTTPMFTLTTFTSPEAGGTIASVPLGPTHASNSVVTLTATASSGFKFKNWSGASSAATNRISLVMNGNKSVTANFSIVPFYSLTKLVSPTNGGEILANPLPGTGGYATGTSVTLTASNHPGFKFSRWSGTVSTNRNPITLVMSTNKLIRAVFTNIPMYKLTKIVTPTNGGEIVVSPLPATNGYAVGTTLTLTASNYDGFKFSRWSGAVSTNRNPITFKLLTNKTITAVFTNIPKYLLNVQASPSAAGYVLASPYVSPAIYPVGTLVTLTAVPNGTNVFGTWQGLPSFSNQVTFSMTLNRSVTALFNNSGKLLFQNATGPMAIWFMQKTNRAASVSLNNGVSPGSNWRLAGAGDFDNSGSKDLLLRGTNGQVALWRMDGNFKTNSTLLKSISTAYHVGGVADFNGDSKADILWQHTNGALSIWIMNVAINTASLPLPNPGSAWKAFASATCDSTNSSPDIFLQNKNDGRVIVWLMNNEGTAKIGAVTLNGGKSPGTGWIAVGATDLNDDGNTDVIFQKADGKLMVWLLNGTTFGRSLVLNTAIAPSWTLRATK